MKKLQNQTFIMFLSQAKGFSQTVMNLYQFRKYYKIKITSVKLLI